MSFQPMIIQEFNNLDIKNLTITHQRWGYEAFNQGHTMMAAHHYAMARYFMRIDNYYPELAGNKYPEE